MHDTAPSTPRGTRRPAMRLAALLLFAALDAGAATPGMPAAAPKDGWASYEVPLVDGVSPPCCHSIRGDGVLRGCALDDRHGLTIDGDAAALPAKGPLRVYLRLRDGSVERVRAYAAECPLQHEGRIVALPAIEPAASVALLADVAERDARRAADGAVAAIAFHAGDAATARLVQWAERSERKALREPALFWLGQTRGEAGAAALLRVLRSDAPASIRSHAVFALSQSDSPLAYPAIAALARDDRDREVRGQAAFWMAQTNDARAAADLRALARDADHEVVEQAVFALSQLDDGGDAALVEVVRGDYPLQAKKRALFWLGQSGSAQAIELFDEVLGAR